jgi:hypothetical protein
MAVSETNRLRYRSVLLSREFKAIFALIPKSYEKRMSGWLFRALFLAPDGLPHAAGQYALADLRDFCTGQAMFSTEPLVMARRIGRREVFERIVNYLNLDEHVVQTLMRLDDGLGG